MKVMLESTIDGLTCLNDWIHKWALTVLSATNRKFIWSNKQDNLELAKNGRVSEISKTMGTLMPASLKRKKKKKDE